MVTAMLLLTSFTRKCVRCCGVPHENKVDILKMLYLPPRNGLRSIVVPGAMKNMVTSSVIVFTSPYMESAVVGKWRSKESELGPVCDPSQNLPAMRCQVVESPRVPVHVPRRL